MSLGTIGLMTMVAGLVAGAGAAALDCGACDDIVREVRAAGGHAVDAPSAPDVQAIGLLGVPDAAVADHALEEPSTLSKVEGAAVTLRGGIDGRVERAEEKLESVAAPSFLV